MKLPLESFVEPAPLAMSDNEGGSGCVNPINTAVSLVFILTTSLKVWLHEQPEARIKE
jgi:hypothetical protein